MHVLGLLINLRNHSLWVILVLLAVVPAGAQRRYDCMANLDRRDASTRGMLGYPRQDWDSEQTYRQLVVLIAFSDCAFSMDDPAAHYNRILNEQGYNEGAGPGSMADYFRDQSGGRFNLQFDVYGPVCIDDTVRLKNDYYGSARVKKALQLFAEQTEGDFSPYDWDGDGRIDQVICIAAGYSGNQVSGYVWPSTGSTYVEMSDGTKVNTYSLSSELWSDGTPCGIGTICHEFSHCLGLPDLYPLGSSTLPFSVVDEWDLMDGGNLTGKGWCPPNYSALEKMLLGWYEPLELTSETAVIGMKPVSEGGEAYLIRHPSQPDEYYLLENRRQEGWDYGLPGEGLLIFYVDYDRELWSNNMVNSNMNHYRYDLVHADNRDYRSWDPADNGRDMSKYTMAGCLRNRYLSTSAYPFVSDSLGIANRELTATSVPASIIPNKPITNIQQYTDGSIAFDVMKTDTPISQPAQGDATGAETYYDLSGRRLTAPPSRGTLYFSKSAHGGRSSVRKHIKTDR